jgi:hypothetical protein
METHGTLMSDIMNEMDSRVLNFIKGYVTTFTRWDMIKFFHENANTQDTAENLARYVGRASDIIQKESKEMVSEGIFRSVLRGEHVVYMLTADENVRQLVADLVQAARDRTFRMKLVYHILRAGGQE